MHKLSKAVQIEWNPKDHQWNECSNGHHVTPELLPKEANSPRNRYPENALARQITPYWISGCRDTTWNGLDSRISWI